MEWNLLVHCCIFLSHLIIFHTHIFIRTKKKEKKILSCKTFSAKRRIAMPIKCIQSNRKSDGGLMEVFIINKQLIAIAFFAHFYSELLHRRYGHAWWMQLKLSRSRAAVLPLCFNTHNASVVKRKWVCRLWHLQRHAEMDKKKNACFLGNIFENCNVVQTKWNNNDKKTTPQTNQRAAL